MSLDNDIQQLTETVNDHADKIANLQGMVLTLFSEMSDRAREMADTQLKVFATLRPLL